MREVVCNTSPLQYLHQLGGLHLLRSIYGRISVPQAVADEIQAGRTAGIDLPDLSALDWIEIRLAGKSLQPLPRDIHRGEAEVLALAAEFSAPLLILDDLAARKHAKLLGLAATGTLGVLVKAKQQGLIDPLKPRLERLEKLGFRLSTETRGEILRIAGEA